MVTALVISNLLFVMMHPLTGSVPVPQIIGGIVFTLAYGRKGELMAPVAIHILGMQPCFHSHYSVNRRPADAEIGKPLSRHQ